MNPFSFLLHSVFRHSFVLFAFFTSSCVLAADLTIEVTANHPVYENNDPITYQVIVTNISSSTVNDISISADFMSITSGIHDAFVSTSISGISTLLSHQGDYATSGDLAVSGASLRSGGMLTYTIKALVSNEAKNDISISATATTVTETINSTVVTVVPATYAYTLDLSVNKTEYTIKNQLTYTLKATNIGRYKVQNLAIDQLFDSLTAASINDSSITAFSNVAISAITSGSKSNAGTFAASGDLSATDVALDVGGSVTYTIQTTVSDKLIGDIITSATSSTKEPADVNSNELTTPSAIGELEITSHTLDNSNAYLVNGQMIIRLSVKNTGSGIVKNYQVQHNVAQLITDLGNDLDINNEDSADIIDNPYATWTSQVGSIGANSLSALNDSGVTIDQVFDDAVSVYPGESIGYVITATLSSVTIGDVKNITATVLKDDGSLANPTNIIGATVSAQYVLSTNDPEIKIVKTTSDKVYTPGISPGNNVIYDITVENTSDKYFANNIKIVDKLSCIETEQTGGTGSGSAFTSWVLNVVSGSDNQGSDAGRFNYGVTQTGDLTLSPDIAPGKKVKYQLIAKVSDTSIGNILDDDLLCNDDITESGTGINMPDGSLSVSKDVDNYHYSPGQELTYTIKVTNNADGFAEQVPVIDDLASIRVTDVYGKSVPAYTSWEVTASAMKIGGGVAADTVTGITTPILSPTILNVKATIQPKTIITYTIKARVTPTANGELKNTVTVDGNVVADRSSMPKAFYLTVGKSAKVGDASGFSPNQASYSKPDNKITYQIVVKNDAANGFATDVNIVDEISAIQADMLEPDNTLMTVFTGWTITANKSIVDASNLTSQEQNDLLNATDVGDYADNTNIDLIAQIPPNIQINYTVAANIDRSDASKIVWGAFNNLVTVTASNGETLLANASIIPKEPNVYVSKTSLNEHFEIGKEVTFDIYVFNKGEGFANNVNVSDEITALDVFNPGWTITAITEGHAKTGSYAGNKATWPNGGNIQSEVDIDPKESAGNFDGMGYVHYAVTGIVKNNYVKEEISNTAEIHDPFSGTTHSSTAQIGADKVAERFNVSILKTSDKVRAVPGEDITYSITLFNDSTSVIATNLTVADLLADVKGVLANDKDGHFENYGDQNPFEYWSVKLPDESSFGAETNENFIYPAKDSSERLDLIPKEIKTFQIKARIKANFVGSNNESDVFTDLLRNDAYVYRDYGEVTQSSHISRHENKRAAPGGNTVRKLYVNGKEAQFYSPGDTLTYTLKVSSTAGYVNNHLVVENLEGLSVELIDGSQGHPFSNKFTVNVEKEDSDGGAGTTDGTADGIVIDDKSINTIIDVAGGDYVLYTVKGIARYDAVGNITIGGIMVRPNEPHLNFLKEVDQLNYEPGEILTYHLIIENNGQGNAYNVEVLDEISNIKVALIDGTTGPAFQPGWTIVPNITGGDPSANAQVGTVVDGQDISTLASIPMGTTIDYVVTTVVNPKAVGDIINILTVDGDRVSALSKPNTEKFNFEKKILAYYDTDGTTVLSTGLAGYKPDGFIEYQIEIKNENKVHLNDISIVDELSKVNTQCYELSSGLTTTCSAFDRWTIQTQVDNSGISNPGSVNDNQDINTSFDLSGTGAGIFSTFVKYTIKAHIRENAIGGFINSAKIDNSHNTASARSVMLPALVSKTHKAYTDTSFSTVKTKYNHQIDDQKVVYRLRIENKGDGLEYGKSLVDKFSALNARLAQTNALQQDNHSGSVYQPNGWKVTATTSGEPTTLINGFVSGDNLDIDLPFVSIAPGGWIDFVMESQIRHESLDVVKITPKYGTTNFSTSLITPDLSALSVEKKIVSIAAKTYAIGDHYKPGDEVKYQFTVTNTEPVWSDNTVIQDLVSNVKVEVIGGSTESALVNTNISHVITSGIDANVDTKTIRYTADGDLDIEAADGLDIAPGESIIFTITGKIREDAVGVIGGNKGTGGTQSVTTDSIPPAPSVLVFEKILTNTTADNSACVFPSNTGSGCEYNPSGQVSYQISVSNNGEGIANDVAIKDLLSTINTSDGIRAFRVNSVHLIEQPIAERFSISGNYDGTGDLDARFDLMPTDTVVFEIIAVVDTSATGTITNTASINSVNTNSIILGAGTATILAGKHADISSYSPGQIIKYTIAILNKSDTNSEVKVVDPISSFVVETANGSMQPALESWSIASKIISDGDHGSSPSYTDISTLPTSGNIDSVIKMAAKHADTTVTLVEIVITGKIRDDAIGKFSNVVTINNNDYRVDEGYILPVKGELSVSKLASKTPATYVPGEVIGFDVAVENIGSGYVTNVNISDLAKNIETDFAAQSRLGKAFEQWDVRAVSASGSLSEIISGTEITGADGYSINYNIAPGETVNLHLEGKVNNKALGDITNKVTVTDGDENKQVAQATYTPEKAGVTVTKVVDKPEYTAGDILTYTIEITNTTAAWAKDVKVTDLFSTIQSTTIAGADVTAFIPGSIAITGSSLTGNSIIPVVNGDDISGYMEIAPNDVVTITASGQLLMDLHGEVKNIVTVELDGVESSAEATSIALIPTVTLTKEAPLEVYIPGETSPFVITVTNQTNAFADDIKLEDLISDLTVETVDGITEQAFDFWSVEIAASDTDTVITNLSSNINEDINVSIDLAPLSTVTFTVSGEVNKKAVGIISNTAKMAFNAETVTAEAQLIPELQKVSFIKTLKNASQQGNYSAGEESEFHIVLTNEASSFAQNIQIKDVINELMVTNVTGQEIIAFSSWDISYQVNNDKYNTTSVTELAPLSAGDIDVAVDLAPNANIEFTVKGIVAPLALGDIINTATMSDGMTTLDSSAVLKPFNIVLVVSKTADKAEYTNDDSEVTFTLKVINRGSTDALNVLLLDEISTLQASNGNPLFTDWTTTISEINRAGSTLIDTQTSVDLHSTQTLKAYEGNAFLITIVGQIAKGLDDDITNTFTATAPMRSTESSGKFAQDSVTIHVKKFADNEGLLEVSKRALKDSIQVGDVVEYEVVIENNNESEFKNVSLEDRYPSGFQYVENSTEVTNTGPDGIFDTADDVLNYQEPSISNVLLFPIGNMLANGSGETTIQESVRVRYLLRATVGVTFGQYINTAYAKTPAEGMTTGPLAIKSNMSSATVEITPDKLFDTASIIGKVFEDHNGDGYQADATAFDITVRTNIDESAYISGSTTLYQNGKEESVKFLNNQIQIDHLFGLSRNRTLPESNKAIIQFLTRNSNTFDFTVKTDDGTDITFSHDDVIELNHTGNKKDSLSAENLNVTRNLYKDGDQYLWEIVIENIGLYEDGIPGVRLLTVEGIVIETDEYGRYHVPDQWVLNKKGKQFLVKVDSDSLPTNMRVISENPKVLRVSPNQLTKFNFSVDQKHSSEKQNLRSY